MAPVAPDPATAAPADWYSPAVLHDAVSTGKVPPLIFVYASGGARTFSSIACDRVDATTDVTSCLRTERGVVTRYSLTEYDADGQEIQQVSVPGIPSRTRLSHDEAAQRRLWEISEQTTGIAYP